MQPIQSSHQYEMGHRIQGKTLKRAVKPLIVNAKGKEKTTLQCLFGHSFHQHCKHSELTSVFLFCESPR